jgi:hypothetical protein
MGVPCLSFRLLMFCYSYFSNSISISRDIKKVLFVGH